jgi:pimeloyl-ACP methyl ester carboxylesterase
MNTGSIDADLRSSEQELYTHYKLSSTERYLDLDAVPGRVRIVEFGDGDDTRPPILLLHGIASVNALAAPLLPYLAEGRRVIALDWPGHGLSDPITLAPGVNLRAHAVSVVTSLLDALDISVVDMVGHSMGGQFSLYTGLDAPDRVRRLVLLGNPGAAFAEVRPALVMRAACAPLVGRLFLSLPLPEPVYDRNSDAMLGAGALASYPPQIGHVGYLAARRPGYARSVASFFRALITPRTGVRPGVFVPHAELSRLTRPALLLWGESDVFLTPADARASLAALPDSATVVTPAGGHAPWLDSLRTCGTHAADFLNAD